MVAFYPIYVNRSDGKLEANSARGREANEPLSDQLDQKPNAAGICDYYRLCDTGDPKELDWRRKLGGMLMKELGGKEPKDRNFILASLPANYRVWEHVRHKAKDSDAPEADNKPSSKTHAGGGNERQDAYLYGHPQGRKKRYRSPAEFFPHLLWLATDETGDSDNCACKFCSPEELETDIQSKIAAKQAKTDARVKAEQAVSSAVSAPSNAPLLRPAASSASTTPQMANAPSSTSGTPLPPFKSPEHKEDIHPYGRYIFRTGEIAWFSRGAAWGLCVIVKREILAQAPSYRVQPLSHPFTHPAQVSCRTDTLRPWLAWSPPQCTHAKLNAPNPHDPSKYLSYDQIDWQAVREGQLGPGDAEVDGSILAAKRAESTFTPFEVLGVQPAQGMTETRFCGIYIGGEKAWIGDALRVRQDPSMILVLHEIIELANPSDPSRPSVTLVGDTYAYRIVQLEPAPQPTQSQGGIEDLALPSRMREDLARRNKVTMAGPDPAKRFSSFWKLVTKGTRMTIAQVKGRWYETAIVYPLLDPREFERQRQSGESRDVTANMNGQGDCNRPIGSAMGGFRAADLKVAKREEAFGRAVPREMRIAGGSAAGGGASRPSSAGGSTFAGVAVPQRQNSGTHLGSGFQGGQQAPQQQQQQQQRQQQHQTPQPNQQYQQRQQPQHVQQQDGGGGGGSAFEQFMNYDGMPGLR